MHQEEIEKIVNLAKSKDEKNLNKVLEEYDPNSLYKLLSVVMTICAIEKNQDALLTLKEVRPKDLKEKVLSKAIMLSMESALQGNNQNEIYEEINKAFLDEMNPIDLCAQLMAQGMIIYVQEGNKGILQKIKKSIPNDFHERIFMNAFRTCALNGHKEEFKEIMNVFSDDLKVIEILAKVMVVYASNGDKEMLSKLNEICPEIIKQKVFTEAMEFCRKLNLEDALNIVMDVCPEELKPKILNQFESNCMEYEILGNMLAMNIPMKNYSKSGGSAPNKPAKISNPRSNKI